MFKKMLLLLAATFAALNFYDVPTAHSNASQPPKGRTNAPGETTCAISGCHVGVINSGAGSMIMDFNAGANNYSPGQTYTITLGITSAGASRWGFEVVALNSSNASVGTFIGNDAQNTATGSANSRQYIYHKNAPIGNNTHLFSFQWTAPATNQGDITFYAIGNAANNNNNASGDLVYTTTREISFNTSVTQVAAGSSLLNAYPNPATEMLNISYSLQKADQTTLILTDLSGKTVATLLNNEYKNAGQYTQTLPLDDIAAGIYLLQISNKHASYLQKVVIAK